MCECPAYQPYAFRSLLARLASKVAWFPWTGSAARPLVGLSIEGPGSVADKAPAAFEELTMEETYECAAKR